MWQRILFRFLFVYLILQIAPWNWFGMIPGVGWLNGAWYRFIDRAVQASNSRVFHVRETLVPVAGSGDTSWAWAQLWLYLSVALIACIVWSLLDRRSTSYPRLGWGLRTVVRFYIASAALSYGIIKLFALQMPFPTTSQLATPLGDFLPMRLSWMFLGYSFEYQFFSGLMETVAGLLLLVRPTVTLGLLAATGAFLNVVMINMSYDVPVKLYSSHLLLACLFLLAWDARRLFTFLVLNRAAQPTSAYEPPFTRSWQRYGAWAVKAFLVVDMLILPLQRGWSRYTTLARQPPAVPFRTGVYAVRTWALNGDTIPAATEHPRRWKDVIFDSQTSDSINTTDSLFWQRYRRGYFRFRADTLTRTAVVWKTLAQLDSTWLFDVRYEMPDTATVRIWAAVRGDSLYAELVLSERRFQLAERQFHWLSEWNR